jgi:hypothetical protein
LINLEKKKEGDMSLTYKTSEINRVFCKKILPREAKKLEELYCGLHFCRGNRGVLEMAKKLEDFVAYSLADGSRKWIIDLRFCSEDCDFLVRFPWPILDKVYNLRLTERVLILIANKSCRKHCRKVVNNLADVLWEEYCKLPARDENIGPIPKKIFYRRIGSKKTVPWWYAPKRAVWEGVPVHIAIQSFEREGFALMT